MRSPWILSAVVALGGVLMARSGQAEAPRFHASAGAAHALGGPQETELGWGGGARVGLELPLGSHFGLEASGSALSLAQGRPPDDPRFATRSFGVGWAVTAAVRANVVGAWVDVGGGIGVTGDQVRPVFEARLGYDVRMGRESPWTVGPFVGYTRIFQTADALRPEDANIGWLGLEVSVGSRPPKVPVVLQLAKNVPPPPPPDRDGDGIVDPQDACPDVPGIPTSDPKTNGCPSDRDGDTIVDVDDACPDVPGIRTTDASTNGCPATPMRLVGDTIELDDVIHFGFGNPDVRESSKPLVQKLAQYLNDRGDITAVEIEGHADEVGSYAYNYNLSRDRALAVKKLLEDYGVRAHITVHAWGKTKPRSSGHQEYQLRENRRVQFIVTRQRQVPVSATDVSGGEEGTHASN